MHQSFFGWREKWGEAANHKQSTILQQKLITATLKVKWAGYDLIRHNYPALNGCDSSYFFPEYVSIVWSSGATVKKGNIVSKGFELWHYYVKIDSTSRELGKVGHNQ